MKKRFFSLLLSLALVLSLIPASVFANETDSTTVAAAQGLANLAADGANKWQVVSGLYDGNMPTYDGDGKETSTTKPNVSKDGMVRVQKNVVPTNVENEFLVYMSVDSMTKEVANYESVTSMLELNPDNLYAGGTGNNFPKGDKNLEPDGGTGNGHLVNKIQGGTRTYRELLESGQPQIFILQIWYGTQLIAEPELRTAVPNSVLYMLIDTGKYIALENINDNGGVISVGGNTITPNADGKYVVPVYLTDAAYAALFNTIISEELTEETVDFLKGDDNAYIEDTMGNLIVYDGFVAGDISGTAPAAVTEPGATVSFNISPKAAEDVVKTDPVTVISEETVTGKDGSSRTTRVTTTYQWNLNVVEIVYKVHLDVMADGFADGAHYDVNNAANLGYYYTFNGEDTQSVTFPVPEVMGTLYELSFTKVDSKTNKPVSGAAFTLTDADNNVISPAVSDATEAEDAVFTFSGLPMGTYTLTETLPPTGYTLPKTNSWTIEIDGYTADPDNYDHIIDTDDIFQDDIGPISSGLVPNDPNGSIVITKTVTANDGLRAPDNALFTFQVSFTNLTSFDGMTFHTVDVAGAETDEADFSGSVTLKAGGKAIISNVPVGAVYTITETDLPGGFATTNSYTGTLAAGAAVDARFTNNYSVKPTTAVITATKTLAPIALTEGQFEFVLAADDPDATPMPEFAIATNGAGGVISFGEIEYTLPGTYEYTVTETDKKAPGYTYDSNTYNVTVEVVDNGNGTLSATVNSGSRGIVFSNTYKAEGTAVINFKKTLKNEKLDFGHFIFGLYNEAGEQVGDSVTNDEDGRIYFFVDYVLDSEHTEDLGTHTYTVKEIIPDDPVPGYTYDKNEYEVTVTVTDNGNGTLKTEVVGDGETFANEYVARDELYIEGTKLVNGQALTDKDAVFSFSITGEAALGNPKDGVPMPEDEDGKVVTTVTNDTSGAFEFGPINYDASIFSDDKRTATYTYTITEDQDVSDGYTYDDTSYEVTVTVTDKGYGELEIISVIKNGDEKVDAIVFDNSYEAEGSASISFSKELMNKDLEEAEFSFGLYDKDDKLVGTAIGNDANGNFVFTLDYMIGKDAEGTFVDQTGEYEYTIKEINDGKDFYDYDDSAFGIVVGVEDNRNGSLTVSVSDDEGNELGKDDSGIFLSGDTFTNVYKAEGTAELTFTKVVKNTTAKTKLKADQFTFGLYDGDTKIAEAKNAADGSIKFTIDYIVGKDDSGKLVDQKGSYTYTVKEIPGNDPNYDYDTTDEYEVTVEVADAIDFGGKLDVTVIGDSKEFSNLYKAYGQADIELTKEVIGTDEMKTFQFGLYDQNDKLIGSPVRNDSEGNIVFTVGYALDSSANDIGTHTYTVKEIPGQYPGYTYDEEPITVTITVEDNGNGELSTDVQYDTDEPVFTNLYEASGSIDIVFNKVVRNTELGDEQFSFGIYEAGGTDPLQMVTNDENGDVKFNIAYSIYDDASRAEVLGEHTYTVKEINDNQAGYTYDETEYSVTVEVFDNGDGTLSFAVTGDEREFTNIYEAYGQTTLTFAKEVVGTELQAEQFSFGLYNENEQLIGSPSWNDEQGNVLFTIGYALDDGTNDLGTHTYTVKEIVPNEPLPGYTYDDTEYTVTVNVTDNEDGTLKVDVQYDTDEPIFTNVYEASGSAEIVVEKLLTGRTLAKDQFTFELYEGETKIAEAKNAADGSVKFTVDYEIGDVGTHEYTVVEVNDAQEGYTYDETELAVTVDVADNGDGTLNVSISGNDQTFTNDYQAIGEAEIVVKKVLTGKDLEEGEFRFKVCDENGTPVAMAENKADGSIVFTIGYDLEDLGSHLYTIEELCDGETGVTYDDTKITVEVVVKDNGDGTLDAQAIFKSESVEFKNSYRPEDLVLGFYGEKKLESSRGRELKDGEFSFVIKDNKGNILSTGVNDANGEIIYSEFAISEPGEYVLLFSEVEGDDDTIVYDPTEYVVGIVVEDVAGYLEVTAVETDIEDLVFVNVDKPELPPTPDTGDSSNAMLWTVTMSASILAMGAALYFEKKRKSSK